MYLVTVISYHLLATAVQLYMHYTIISALEYTIKNLYVLYR